MAPAISAIPRLAQRSEGRRAPAIEGSQTLPFPTVGDWFVVHTRSRQEKAVAKALNARGVAYFLPLSRKLRYHGSRKLFSDVPLFPSYLFLRGRREDAYDVDRNNRIAGIIPVTTQHRLNEELRHLHDAISRGVELDLYPFLVAGTPVVVKSGPLFGLRGVVDRRLKQNRLILQVEALGQAVALEIEAELLDPLTVD